MKTGFAPAQEVKTELLTKLTNAIDRARPYLNQHSGVIAAIGLLLIVWLIVRRRGRIIRWPAALATIVALVTVVVTTRSSVPNITDEATLLSALASGRPVVVEITSRTCLMCVLGNRAVDGFADEYAERVDVFQADVATSAGRSLAIQHAVTTLPSFVVFGRGGRVIKQLDVRGSIPVAELRRLVTGAIQNPLQPE